jgi:hypothetical protein
VERGTPVFGEDATGGRGFMGLRRESFVLLMLIVRSPSLKE